MRRLILIVVALGWALPAGATDIPKDKGSGISAGGGGASSGGGGISSIGQSSTGNSSQGTIEQDFVVGIFDKRAPGQPGKWWTVSGTWETHGTFIRQDLEGTGV